MTHRWFVACTFGALIAACSSGGSLEPTRAEEQAIQGGAVDTTHAFAVALVLDDPTSHTRLTCSGTLIAPNVVITARHCVEFSPGTIDCSTSKFGDRRAPDTQFTVTTDTVIADATHWYGVAKIVTPDPKEVCGNDFAALILGETIPTSVATPATPGIAAPLTDHERYGTMQTVIGYGLSSPGTATDGTRRARERIAILCIPEDPRSSFDCFALDPTAAAHLTPREFEGGAGTCEGDSGAGAFGQLAFDEGEPVAVGVLSRGMVNDTTCAGAIYSRVDAYRALLVDVAAEAATLGKYDVPAWASASNDGADSSSGCAIRSLRASRGRRCAADVGAAFVGASFVAAVVFRRRRHGRGARSRRRERGGTAGIAPQRAQTLEKMRPTD